MADALALTVLFSVALSCSAFVLLIDALRKPSHGAFDDYPDGFGDVPALDAEFHLFHANGDNR